jgi:hypothetical protein
MPMVLTIKVEFETGIEMENKLNKAIDELSTVLKIRGISEMELIGRDMDNDGKLVYEVKIV